MTELFRPDLPDSYRKGTRPKPKKKRTPTKRKRNSPKTGSKAGGVRLSDADVREIRELAAGGTADTDIAARFGISKVTVANLRRGGTRIGAGGPITRKKAQGGK
jgi:DNA-binding NarL/FixJ family response regulator